jgi:hypothetical protein
MSSPVGVELPGMLFAGRRGRTCRGEGRGRTAALHTEVEKRRGEFKKS